MDASFNNPCAFNACNAIMITTSPPFISFAPCPVAVLSFNIVKGFSGISGSNTVSKCPIKNNFFPFCFFADVVFAVLFNSLALFAMGVIATKCPARFMLSGILTQCVCNPAASNSFANKAPTFFTPSIFKVPLFIFTDSFNISMALGRFASI